MILNYIEPYITQHIITHLPQHFNMVNFVKSGAPVLAALSGIIAPKDLNIDSPSK